MTEHCYKCGATATSREHIPPLCLFPEKKDIGVDSFRKNLITVPSCNEHNAKKSKDDEFLMACLTGIVGNNPLAYFHTKTKVKRALDRKNASFIHSIFKNPKELFAKTPDGKVYPIIQGSPHFDRLVSCFEHIAYGLYLTEYKKIFKGQCYVFLGFLKYDNENFEKLKMICKQTFELQAKNFETKGFNQEVFKYQFGQVDDNGLIPLKLTFYEGTEVFISFLNDDIKLSGALVFAQKLISDGIKTIVKFDNGESIEFN